LDMAEAMCGGGAEDVQQALVSKSVVFWRVVP
jgi:hypothetical protein